MAGKTYLSGVVGVAMVVWLLLLYDQYVRLHYRKPGRAREEFNYGHRSSVESHDNGKTENAYWRTKELDRLSETVQRRLFYIQNPRNCEAAKKVLCKFKGGNIGYGAAMHDVIFCLIVAYATQRTLIFDSSEWAYSTRGLSSVFLPLSENCTSITNQTPILTDDLLNVENIQVIQLPRNSYFDKRPLYLPLSIPADLGDDLIRVHMNPSGWWMGQVLMFATKYNPAVNQYIEESIKKLGFMNPIVGIHVRGGDKFIEADIHHLDEYMDHATKWFETYEKDNGPVQRRVYLATDEIPVIKEAMKSYPGYTFITSTQAAAVAKTRKTRFTEYGLRSVLRDIEMLSRCDFFVGTLSSNMGKIVHSLMHVRYWDAPSRIRTLDIELAFHSRCLRSMTEYKRYMDTLVNGNIRRIRVFRNMSRTNQATIVTLDNEQFMVQMPTYPEVPKA